MSIEMTAPSMPKSEARPDVTPEQLHCALTGVPISADEAYWAAPLITARDLVTTVAKTAISAPGSLGAVLMADMPDVPYAQEAREALGARRSTEQVKLLVMLLLVLAVVVTPFLLILW